MDLLFPGFLAVGVLGATLPVILHFLRRQPTRRVVFPSLRFLGAVTQRTQRRHQIMRWIVLALRCAAFGLLAAAFARPFFSGAETNGRKSVVIVVDNTFSLQSKGRWNAIRNWARDRVGRMGEGDKLGLLLASPRPTWLVAPTTDISAVLEKLTQLQAGWQSGRIEPALRLAADTLAAGGAAEQRIVCLTDHQRIAWRSTDFSKHLPDGVAVDFPSIPPAVTSQAALDAPVLTRTEHGIHAGITVRNFSGKQTRSLKVFQDGAATSVAEKSVELGDHATVSAEFELPAAVDHEARLRFSLDPDDLPADDSAYGVLTKGADRTVLLDAPPGAGEADYLSSALTSTALLKPSLRVAPASVGSWPSNTVAVLRNDASFAGAIGSRLEAFLGDGGSALVFAGTGPAQQQWLNAHGRVVLRQAKIDGGMLNVHDWAMDHPIVAAMAEHEVDPLLGWDFRQGWALPIDAVEPLGLWSENEAAIGEIKVGAGRILLCGFAPDRRGGDWPLHAAFVPFLHRAVTYLLGASVSAPAPSDRVGAEIRLPAENGTWRAVDGPASSLPSRKVGSTVVASEPGIYEYTSGGERKLFAVNLAPEESDPTLWTDGAPWLELVSSKAPAHTVDHARVNLAAFDAEQRSSLWWWAVVALAGVLLLELGLANRTAR